jgi:predicted acetyltransferase
MLASYADALRQGWSPNTSRDVSGEHLAQIERDPKQFLADLVSRQGSVRLADGRDVPKLPFRLRWMWDGTFCGAITLRWQEGTLDLPPYVSGHIGYAVVPWKRGHGFATRALRHMLAEAKEVGLARVTLTTDPDNIASQKVILANSGRFVCEREEGPLPPQRKFLYDIGL